MSKIKRYDKNMRIRKDGALVYFKDHVKDKSIAINALNVISFTLSVMYEHYKGSIAIIRTERDRLRVFLAQVKCPNSHCNSQGTIAHQIDNSEYEYSQCPWCFERGLLVSQSK